MPRQLVLSRGSFSVPLIGRERAGTERFAHAGGETEFEFSGPPVDAVDGVTFVYSDRSDPERSELVTVAGDGLRTGAGPGVVYRDGDWDVFARNINFGRPLNYQLQIRTKLSGGQTLWNFRDVTGGQANERVKIEDIQITHVVEAEAVQLGPSVGLWGLPPARQIEDVLVGLPGSRISTVTHAARDIVLPLTITAEDTGDVDRTLNGLMVALDPVISDERIRLTYTSPFGAEQDRHIDAVLVGGQSGLVVQSCTAQAAKVAIALRAEDPYWRSTEREDRLSLGTNQATPAWDSATWDTGALWGPVFSESFDSDIAGQVGAVNAWPTWEVAGPCTSFLVRRGAEFLSFKGDVDAGETLRIVTDPVGRSVTVDGADRYEDIAVRSTFWSFPPSTATTYLVGVGGRGPSTSATVRWVDKWLTCS